MLKLKQLETTAKITNCETWIVFLQFSIFTNKGKIKGTKSFFQEDLKTSYLVFGWCFYF